ADAVAMQRVAPGVEYGDVDPAEISAIAGCPDHGVDICGTKVEVADRCGYTRRVRPSGAGRRIIRQAEAFPLHIFVHHVEQERKGGIALRETFGKAAGDFEHPVARGRYPPKQRDALLRKIAEVDRAPAIGTGDRRI